MLDQDWLAIRLSPQTDKSRNRSHQQSGYDKNCERCRRQQKYILHSIGLSSMFSDYKPIPFPDLPRGIHRRQIRNPFTATVYDVRTGRCLIPVT